MIENTLLNVLILELKIYCGPDTFYGRSKFGQYDEVKNRAPLLDFLILITFLPNFAIFCQKGHFLKIKFMRKS